MNQEQFKQWLAIQTRKAVALERIAQLLEQSAPRKPPSSYEAILENFNQFDWSSINAKVESKDQYGVASVIWQRERYI